MIDPKSLYILTGNGNDIHQPQFATLFLANYENDFENVDIFETDSNSTFLFFNRSLLVGIKNVGLNGATWCFFTASPVWVLSCGKKSFFTCCCWMKECV